MAIVVILTTSRAGMNFVQHVGDEVTVKDKEAGRMFAKGQCKFKDPADKQKALDAAGLKDPSIDPGEDLGSVAFVAGLNAGTSEKAGLTANTTTEVDDENDSDAINGVGLDTPPDDAAAEPVKAVDKAKAAAKKKAAAAKPAA